MCIGCLIKSQIKASYCLINIPWQIRPIKHLEHFWHSPLLVMISEIYAIIFFIFGSLIKIIAINVIHLCIPTLVEYLRDLYDFLYIWILGKDLWCVCDFFLHTCILIKDPKIYVILFIFVSQMTLLYIWILSKDLRDLSDPFVYLDPQ